MTEDHSQGKQRRTLENSMPERNGLELLAALGQESCVPLTSSTG